MQQSGEHLTETRPISGQKEDTVGVQMDHTLSIFQVKSVGEAISSEEAIGLPCQADMSFEPATEENLVEIAKCLDG